MEVVEYLWKRTHGAVLADVTSDGNNAMLLAAWAGQVEPVKLGTMTTCSFRPLN